MITKTVFKAAAGPTQWLTLNSKMAAAIAGLSCVVSVGASLTYKAQYASYDPVHDKILNSNMTRSTTTLTVVWPNHGLSTLDSVTIGAFGAIDGTYDVASTADANTFTVTVANTGSTTPTGQSYFCRFHVQDDVTITAKTGSFNGVSSVPASYVRANITTYVSGSLQFTVTQGSTY